MSKRVTLTIEDEVGLHARPATEFVQKAKGFAAKISISKDGKQADAKSILQVLGLAAGKGAVIEITAEGPDEEEAINALADFIRSQAAKS